MLRGLPLTQMARRTDLLRAGNLARMNGRRMTPAAARTGGARRMMACRGEEESRGNAGRKRLLPAVLAGEKTKSAVTPLWWRAALEASN